MYVQQNASIERFTLPGIDHQTLADAGRGLRALSVWRQSLAPKAATPPHRHDCEEVVIVTAGRGELVVGDRSFAFGPDSTVVVPANLDHQIVNVGDCALDVVAILSTADVDVRHVSGAAMQLPWQRG
jgi:mannose-6-phosphate isomerase-like protein (cupin superfamily)